MQFLAVRSDAEPRPEDFLRFMSYHRKDESPWRHLSLAGCAANRFLTFSNNWLGEAVGNAFQR
jgi:hypothetical protein